MFTGDPTIQEKMLNGDSLFLASPTVGELYYGAQKSDNVTENLRRVNTFVENHVCLSCDLETARWYGIIRNQLQKKGRPIPNNDIWIAAVAMQRGLILATRDSHFDEIESLQTEYW
jgi:tRNA(fMet)-specific endonuclease VapC